MLSVLCCLPLNKDEQTYIANQYEALCKLEHWQKFQTVMLQLGHTTQMLYFYIMQCSSGYDCYELPVVGLIDKNEPTFIRWLHAMYNERIVCPQLNDIVITRQGRYWTLRRRRRIYGDFLNADFTTTLTRRILTDDRNAVIELANDLLQKDDRDALCKHLNTYPLKYIW